jgi:hypothetical protein
MLGTDIDNERQIVSDYRDYQKIDDFYSTVKSRNHYLSQNQVSAYELKIANTVWPWRLIQLSLLRAARILLVS